MFLFSKDQIYSNPYEQIPDNEDISERDRLEFGHMEINQSTSTSQSPSDYNHQHQQAMNSNSSSSRIKGYLNSSTYNQNRYCTKFILLLIAIPSLVTIIYSRYFAGILLQTTLSKTTTFKPVTHPESPTALWGVVTKPYPTGAFWTNLAVRGGDSPIAVLPYGIKTVDAGIQVSYGATRRSVSQIAISDPFVTDLQISATQGYVSRSIEAYDNVSVTMGYHTQQNGKYKTHLVKGSPYITVVYDGATPVISSSLMRILTVESRVVKNNMGVQYIVTLGNFQKWLVYCSEPVALSWKEDTLTSPQPIKGIIRVAFLPLQTLESSFSILVNYIQRYPTGATMAITHPTATSSLVTFSYSSVGIGSLLMLALTHHVQAMGGPSILTNETRVAQIAYYPVYCSKGRMKAVVGDVWKLIYNMPQIGWNYVLSEAIPLPKLDEIGRNLILDVKTNLPNAPDVYSFGKQLARMARLAVLADSLGIAEARQQAISIVETSILPWLQGLNQNPLLYERTYGGVITTNGFNDPNSDFGNGYYNDHHFHYGYMIYAAAVISRFDAAFYDANRNQLDTIVRDICNPDATDSDFPFARHKDFYDGHSWASGLFPQANGKGQESSSEAANAYYACYLYGLATNNPTLMQFSHTLLSMEVQATQLYWHMSNSDTYDPVFATGRMVGNVGGLDVTASTWFGSQLEFVHGINM